MKTRSIGWIFLAVLFAFAITSCENPDEKAAPKSFSYEHFRDSLRYSADTLGKDSLLKDTANIFDSKVFTPGKDSLNTLLTKIDTLWHRDAKMMEQMDSLIKRLKKVERNYSEEEKQKVLENIHVLDSFLTAQKQLDTTHSRQVCRESDCRIFARVNKRQQKLFLYIDGELKDSFLVSTGMKNYTTPNMSTKPQGPIL
ncbi:MAG TPA: L,D-transpeptidase, partial [Allocoleopsis sp.]